MMGESTGAAAAPSAPARPLSLYRPILRLAISAALMGCALFLTSARLNWTRAWIFLSVTLAAQSVVTIVLHRNRPDLVIERSRIQQGTKWWDKVLMPIIAIIGPVAIWCVAGWDVRSAWPPAIDPAWSAVGIAVCAASPALTFWAMLTNRFFSATVRMQRERNQVVVDQGPYQYVRHPGYSGALLFTMASPIALGSIQALIPAALTSAALALRTALEDSTLRKELDGYANYSRRVRYRLVPGLW